MNKKIGLVSCYFKNNYGSQLQAYATQRILKEYGCDVKTINISQNKDFANGKKKYYISQVFNWKFIKTKLGMIKLKIDKKINRSLGKNIEIRNRKFEEFKKIYDLTEAYKSYKTLNEISYNYDAILVGSDQLWLPVNVVADYYTLNWVPDDVKKISYATSFGVSNIPDRYKERYNKFLNRIDYLSTREQSGKSIIEELIGRKAEVVCDPTLLFNGDEWMKIQTEDRIINDKYILCYFLGNSIEYRKFAEKIKEETGFKIVSLNHCDEYVKYSDIYADKAPYDIGPSEFLNLIRNAEYVCTDSFHGTVFSLIYNKYFFVFRRHKMKSKVSTNSRLDSLLEMAGVKERLLVGNEEVKEALKLKIDFNRVNENIDNFRNMSKKFLEQALELDKKKELFDNEKIEDKFIKVLDKSECCGCTACFNICPKNAIEMLEDEEGFLYPNVNKEKCINCGKCKNVCPILKSKNAKIEQKGYVLNNKNEEIRKDSTSGGAFTPIAEYVLNKNGVVFGAAFDEKFNVIHKYVEDIEKINIFRGSKYVQSYLGDSFKKVKEFLEDGRYVCFSGTPCQVEGLLSFLNKDYEKLITVDVMCHAVPSPLVWKKYCNYIRQYKLGNEDIEKVLFRDKSKYGFKYSTMTLKSKNKEYSRGVESDPYLRAFFGDLSDRPSCYNCAFKKQYHESDFTIWDCFVAEKFDKDLDDDKGTSRVLVNTQKGMTIFQKIKDNFKYTEVDVENLVSKVKEMLYSVDYPNKRKKFFKDINNVNEKEFFETYFPNNIKVKLERYVRIILIKTGMYKKIKSIAKRILRK